MHFRTNKPEQMAFEKVKHRVKNLGHGLCMVYGKDDQYICKLEKSKYSTWGILESCTGYKNYGYETKIEAVASAYYGKDCRMFKTGL